MYRKYDLYYTFDGWAIQSATVKARTEKEAKSRIKKRLGRRATDITITTIR